MITKQDISRGEFDDSLIRAFSFAKDICGLLYITLRGWYGYFNVNSPFVLCYYSIFEMRSSQICKNDRENLHVILHLHLDSTNGWMRNTDAVSSLWSEMPSLKKHDQFPDADTSRDDY